MPDVLLKIDGDTAALVSKLAEVAIAHSKSKKHLEDQKSLSGEIFGNVGKTLAGMGSLVAIAGAFSDALARSRDRAEEISKKVGGIATSLGPALQSLGVSGKVSDSIQLQARAAQGAVTTQQATAFIGKLGSINDEREGTGLPKLTQQQVIALNGAYQQYGDAGLGEGGGLLLKRAREGRYGFGIGRDFWKDAADIAGSRPGESEAYRQERDIQREESRQEFDAEHYNSDRQGMVRRQRAAYKNQSDSSPYLYAIPNLIQSAPIIGDGVRAINEQGSYINQLDVPGRNDQKEIKQIITRDQLRPRDPHNE